MMLSWIPLLGPIIQGVASIFNGFTNMKVVQLQTAAQTTIAETNASAQIIQSTKDDIGLRIMRDMVCFPVVIWSMIIGWDSIMVRHYPQYIFIVEKYPDSVAYLPYAVLIFLLGNIGINTFNRK